MSNSVAGAPGLDPTLPDVSIILGGVERHLCFDYNAIVHVEKLTGINLVESAFGKPSATTARALLFAALLKESPDLKIEDLNQLITMRNFLPVWNAVQTAWFASTELDEEEKAAAVGEVKAQDECLPSPTSGPGQGTTLDFQTTSSIG